MVVCLAKACQSLGHVLRPRNGPPVVSFVRGITATVSVHNTAAWKKMLARNPAQKESDVPEGEKYFWLDTSMLKDRFPTLETMIQSHDGVMFKDLPVVNMRVSKNNTIMSVRQKGMQAPVCLSSCGTEGFKNCRKGTTVAAQAVGVSIGLKMKRRGIKTARLAVKGFGPGRMAAVEGLQMTGVDIVSVSDWTESREFGPRPRKARRL